MVKKVIPVLPVFLALIITSCGQGSSDTTIDDTKRKPNLIILYVDDLGYADVGSYGAIGVATPNIDSLAAGGIRFTDAHSSAATCTPSRYSLLTGEHGFRSQAEVLPGDAPLLVPPSKPTLPAMLKKAGYRTAVVGKWHLGLGNGQVDWNTEIKPGPLEIGFDYSFLLPATGDRVPTVYVENYRVVNLDKNDPITVSYVEKVGSRPTGIENPELLRIKADRQHSDTIVNGVSRIGSMAGGESALWIDEQFPDVFTQKAINFIRKNKDRPFFLFHSFHDIHVPRLPHPRFIGKSTMGPRGDAIAQVDWMTGEIIRELKALGIDDNTMVIFTSDNGPVLNDGYDDQAAELLGEHKPTGPFRGGKYSAFEGGTRVPMIVSWPETVAPKQSNALISQMDIYASMATLLGVALADNEAIDSLNILNVLLGRSNQGREYLIKESVGTLSLRHGHWKYIVPFSGEQIPAWLRLKGIEGGLDFSAQLFDLSRDRGERTNVSALNKERVVALQQKVNQIIESGY